MINSCGSKCVKYFLAFFNFIFFVGGLVLAGFAGYEAFNPNSSLRQLVIELKSPMLLDGLYILLAVGLFLALLSFFGCWGALAENKCLLITYFVLVLIIFLLQLAGIIVSLVKFKAIKNEMIRSLSQKNATNPLVQSYRYAMGQVESKFHCCGITGPDNYHGHVPSTCYEVHSRSRRYGATDAPSAASSGQGSSTTSSIAAASLSSSSPSAASVASSTSEALPPTSSSSKSSVSSSSSAASSSVGPIATAMTTSATATTTTASIQTAATAVTAHLTMTAPATAATAASEMYRRSCEAVLKPYLWAAGGVAIGILLLEILVLAFVCCLITAIKQGYTPV